MINALPLPLQVKDDADIRTLFARMDQGPQLADPWSEACLEDVRRYLRNSRLVGFPVGWKDLIPKH